MKNKMLKYFVITILTIAALSKGQQQQQKPLQQQINELLTTTSHKSKPQPIVEIEKQQIQQKEPIPSAGEQTYRPITFPTSDEDLTDRFQAPLVNNNLVTPNVEAKVTTPQQELTRPTRRVMAATVANVENRYTDDQLDYVRDFAWKMFQGSKLPSTIGNLVLSPIQPQLQLSLLRTAASGLTEEEIGQTIQEISPNITRSLIGRLRSANSVSTNLGVASAIFTADNLKLNDSFAREASNRQIDVVPVNFNVPVESGFIINNWVANATNNLIKNIFKPDANRPVRMLLANTIYFNGEWKYGFSEVKNEPFETTEKLIKNVPMMKNLVSLRSGTIVLRNGFSGTWVELPYRGDEFSMVIITPQQRHYLDEFIRSMRVTDFQDVLKQLTNSYKKLVHLSMPKFSVQSSFSVLNSILKMGIVDLFARTSQLPYLATNEPDVRVDDILQQGILSVDEKGTVASVATISHVVTLSLNSAPEEIFFTVDQPFLSIIVDKRNRVPLFISKIYDP